MSRTQEIVAILALIVAVLACVAGWLAVPQVQQAMNLLYRESPSPSPTVTRVTTTTTLSPSPATANPTKMPLPTLTATRISRQWLHTPTSWQPYWLSWSNQTLCRSGICIRNTEGNAVGNISWRKPDLNNIWKFRHLS